VRKFIDANISTCRSINRILAPEWRTDGNYWFQQNILVGGFDGADVVYDLGGGSRPWFTPEAKESLGLKVIGLDIDAAELRAAPKGSYDEIIAADLCSFVGDGTADKVICQATLEHVPDADGALRAISTVLKHGGKAYVFAPCRNAIFARLNRLIRQDLKRGILASIFPYAREGHDGFHATYDRCTPKQIEALALAHGLRVQFRKIFWASGYFYAFVPAYLAWRGVQRIARAAKGDEACESFCFVFQKD